MMPVTILSRVLAGLERTYKFKSSQKGAPNDMELDLPIQLVHDLSAEAAMGAGVGPANNGFWIANYGVLHVATGTITTTPDPFNPVTGANGFPSPIDARDLSIWMYDVWGYTSDGTDLSSITLQHYQASTAVGPSNAVGGPQVPQIIFRGTSESRNSILMLSTTSGVIAPRYPFRMLRGEGAATLDSYFKIISAAVGAGTVTNVLQLMLWLGPKGIAPPLFGK